MAKLMTSTAISTAGSSSGRGRGQHERLDAPAVRLYKGRLECLIDVQRFASAISRDRSMAGPAEVLGIRQLSIDVTLGGHGLARASCVIGDAMSSLNSVASAASRARSSLVASR